MIGGTDLQPNRSQAADDPFAAMYARTFPRIWSALGRMGVWNAEDRRDLAQDVYLIASQKMAARDPSAPELAWLLTIARHVVRNHRTLMRTTREQAAADIGAVALDAKPNAPTAEDVVGARLEYAALTEGLSEERLEALELVDVEGFTAAEVAATLGIPEGTVRTRLRLAREDVMAAARRIEAHDAHRAGGRRLPVVVPFGMGAGSWQHVRGFWEHGADRAQHGVWRGISRAAVRAAAVGAAAGSVGGAVAAGTAAATRAVAAACLGVGFVLGGATVGATMRWRTQEAVVAVTPVHEAAAVPAIASATAPPLDTPHDLAPAPVTTTTSAPGGAATRTASVGSAAPAGASAPTSQIDREEMDLIARAEVAFARHDRAATQEAIDAHAARYPHGKLAPEREAIRAKLSELPAPQAKPDAGAPHGRIFGSDE